jgi:uncharacterized membrane protein
MDPNTSGSLDEQLAELRSRVRLLEQTLIFHGIALQNEEAAPQPVRSAESATLPPASGSRAEDELAPALTQKVTETRRLGHSETVSPEDHDSLESRIGSQWFNRIGILAVLIGMAWFLKLAIDNHWIGPLGRVLVGLIAGAGLVAWSERIRSRGYSAFSYSLKALGSSILYLSLWAAFSLFHLIPSAAAFAAMVAVTAFNGFMSWLHDSELLALYAIVGGLSVPILVSTGENHEVTLFSYLLLLDVAVLVLVALRPWSRLLFGAFSGTVLFVLGWWFTYYTDAQFGRTAFFVGCFFVLFAIAPRLVRVTFEHETRISGWETLALVLLPVSNAALGFIAFYNLFDSSNSKWAGPWLAIGFATFYLLLLRLPEHGRLHRSPALLSAIHLTAAVVFLSIAIPLKAHGRWLTIGWLAEGAALLWLARRIESMLLRVLALLCLILGLNALVLVNPAASAMPILNQRFGTYCVGLAAFAFAFLVARQAQSNEGEPVALQWPTIAAAAVLIVNGLTLLAVGWEIHSFWWFRQWQCDRNLMHDYRMYAQFTYSAFFMAFGAILLGVGFWRRSAYLRWQALLLLAATIGKVFLVDISELSQAYRIFSFIGLGVLLLAVSFVYQRDLLNLRGHERRIS